MPGRFFTLTIPKSPYLCPPGPDERACLVADILKRKGGGRVTVLDANPSIQAEESTFENAFNNLYRNIVEYVPKATLHQVDPERRLVDTSLGEFTGDVVNIIPQQRAPGFVRKSGLTAGGMGWAKVDPRTYASTVPDFENVHVIGDSQATGQPKSAHMANSQAKVCADAIIRSLAGVSNNDPERVLNITTNSACYSPITYDEASWLTTNFAYVPPSEFPDDLDKPGEMGLQHIGEADRWSKDNYEEMFAWASNLFTDSFH